jgi:hypothetical protein
VVSAESAAAPRPHAARDRRPGRHRERPGKQRLHQIGELEDHLADLQVTKEEALRAHAAVPDVDAMAGNPMESFHECLAGTYPDEKDVLRALNPLAGWEGELASWRLHRGIEYDALEFNLAPLIERLRSVYELVTTSSGVHAFIR